MNDKFQIPERPKRPAVTPHNAQERLLKWRMVARLELQKYAAQQERRIEEMYQEGL